MAARNFYGPEKLSFRFATTNRTLCLRPNLAQGWRRLPKTWGFCEDVLFESLNARTVRVQLKLLARPVLEPSHLPPRLVDETGSDANSGTDMEGQRIRWGGAFRYRVRDEELEVTIDLIGDADGFNPVLPWRLNKAGTPYAYFQSEGLEDGRFEPPNARMRYALQVLVVARPRPGGKGPIEREWLKRFFPGGLPSLGKRR